LKVAVSDEDIAHGSPMRPTQCAISRAIRRAVPKALEVAVYPYRGAGRDWEARLAFIDRPDVWVPLTPEIAAKARAFDDDELKEAFEFELAYEEPRA
jgi:hypothetical protein